MLFVFAKIPFYDGEVIKIKQVLEGIISFDFIGILHLIYDEGTYIQFKKFGE